MSLEENAVPDHSAESNSPVAKPGDVQENASAQPASLEQPGDSVAPPPQAEPVANQAPAPEAEAPKQPVEKEQAPAAANVDANQKTSEQASASEPEEQTASQEESVAETKTEPASAPRVTLNPAGAAEAKAVPSIASDKTEEDRQAEAASREQAQGKSGSAEQVPTSEPVDIPETAQLDTDLEAQLEAAMQSPQPESAASDSDATESSTPSLTMPKDDDELEPGARMKGKVDAIDDENIIIDIGFRMSGILSKRNLEGEKVPELGATIAVVVGSVDLAEGVVHLALPNKVQRAGGDWNAIAVGQTVECIVEKTNKGGLSVLVSQLQGFMPAGQVDLHFVGDLEPFVGQKLTARVIDVNPKKRNLVVSRRALLQEERDQNAATVWESLIVGELRAGTVKTIKEYGAFVDIGGVDGLLHVREISWTRIKHPSDVLKQGQQVEVKILNIDNEKKKISLGMKQLMGNPWDHAEQKFAKNTVVTGTVKSITDFGAFVEIEEGLEGLIHVSELDFRRVNKVTDILKVGQEVEAQVLEINKNKQRISLSIKALKPKPKPSAEQVARNKADVADEKQRREAAEKRSLTLKGGNSDSKGGGLFGNPGDFGK